MTKEKLRSTGIAKLKQFSEEEKKGTEKQLHAHLLTSYLWKQAETVGITISQEFEWDTMKIIETGWKQGKTVCVPKCFPATKGMEFYQIDTYEQLEVVYYNLLEPKRSMTKHIPPERMDSLLVPGIIFDRQGYRIGFGGGYYDRFLVKYKNKTASILHSSQLIDTIPKDPFDLPVDHLITEQGWI